MMCRGCDGLQRAAVAMTVDVVMVAVKRLYARNAVSETLAQIKCVVDSTS